MTLVLIDISGWLYAAHHCNPNLCRSDGTATGATYGVIGMLWRFLRNPPVQYSHIACVFDPPGPSWRASIAPSYKANRHDKPNPVKSQYAMVRDGVAALGVAGLEAPGYEADDVIATYARRGKAEGIPVVVVSADKDLYQLVDPPDVRVFNQYPRAAGGKPDWIDLASVYAKFGTTPRRVPDAQALIGDPTDGYKGVPGIGSRIAGDLIGRYGSLEGVIDAACRNKRTFALSQRIANLIADNADQAKLAKKLATLDRAADIFVPIKDLRAQPPEGQRIATFLTIIESRELRDRIIRELAIMVTA